MVFVSLNSDAETVRQIQRCNPGSKEFFFDRLILPPGALEGLFLRDSSLFADGNVTVEAPRAIGEYFKVTDTLFKCHIRTSDLQNHATSVKDLQLRYDRLWNGIESLMTGSDPVCFVWRAHTLNAGQDFGVMKGLAQLLASKRLGLFVLYLHSDGHQPLRMEGNLIIAGISGTTAAEEDARDGVWDGIFRRISPHLNLMDRFGYKGLSNPVPIRELDGLPAVLEYFGEFGAELVLFVPFVAWLSSVGLMRDRSVLTYKGMRCFYDDLKLGGYAEKDEQRSSVEPKFRPYYLPVKDEHTWDWALETPFHLYRNYRDKFRVKPVRLPDDLLRKPVLVIHNKYNDEFGRGPINNIPLTSLEQIIEGLREKFSIIYIRHGMSPLHEDYSEDHNTFFEYEDRALLSRYQDVFNFDDLYDGYGVGCGMNEFKNHIYSRAYYVIASQGGGSFQCASYPGGVIVIFHRFGNEMHRAYTDGFFKAMSNPAPTLMLCLDEDDISHSIEVLKRSTIVAERVCFHQETKALVESLLPTKQKKKYEAGRESTA